MLAWVVIYRRHLRHSTPIPSSLHMASAPIDLSRSYREDPDPVGTPSASLPIIALSPLAATLMDLPASVANKRLTVGLTPLDATLTKNRGWGQSRVIVHLTVHSTLPLIFRMFFKVPYSATPLFATLAKTAGCVLTIPTLELSTVSSPTLIPTPYPLSIPRLVVSCG